MATLRPVLATRPPPACSEQDLVAAVRRGDDRAFEELFSRYRSRVGSYVRGMVRDHGRTEDIVQDVFISALRRLRETECPIAFNPWIHEIARNACIDEFRRIRRVCEVPLETEENLGPVDLELPSPDPSPAAAMESKQRLEDLRDAFRGLSANHHRILVLREFEGLSYREIGKRMGMSRPMVESTLFRARRRLSEEYEDLESGRRCREVRSAIKRHGAHPRPVIGIRERRQLTRHLAHCQSCRREALGQLAVPIWTAGEAGPGALAEAGSAA